ncbi:fibronectin/fibrinogen-binding protein [Clostridium fermenticellae]|uniref:Rqc2 homolog RqcH n=1 Tax=Clostridium fermenticellae TaxID=2068654 RepID=A0A386H4F8_9CLOT|nr:NFACT RNA binding domain-containing protein [Clostridium fermenticellae]AYD40617.1 fibronectin/fibrinogen-binding protein [Clostridium fermenticellae]
MSLDGIFLYTLIDELKKYLLNGKVEKVNQPEKDEIVLSIKNSRKTYKLLISASPVYPKIHITNAIKSNPITPPMFCMVLRKYINSSKLINIRQLDTDRIIFLDFKSTDELGFNSIYTLVIEIMGRHSNITLVRSRDNMIMDSIKHIGLEINTVRCIYPNIPYILPPKSLKLNPFDYTFHDLTNFLNDNEIKYDKKFFSSTFTGISTLFSNELFYRFTKNNNEFTFNNIKYINNFFISIMSDIKSNNFYFSSYFDGNIAKDFYCQQMTQFKNLEEKIYSSPSKLIEEFYYKKDKNDRLKNKSSDLQKLLNVNLDRCNKKVKILKNNLTECLSKDKYMLYGNLLTSNIYSMKKGDSAITVQNYYDENLPSVEIKLNNSKTPSENIQAYFKKYNKMKKTEEAAKSQLEITKNEIEYLESVITNLRNADDYESIEEIKKELMSTGYIRFKKNIHSKKTKPLKPLKFISSDGIDIYVGKNNFQNDYLTLKFADKRDIWMHTKNIPGSHVIVKNFKDVPDRTLEEAAKLAAYYSKSKESSKVPVDYTQAKNVHKPNGAKPGMVIYYTNKTIYVDPEKPKIEEILK